jgi:3-hydroxybutyryl-CoA dehydrogenase
MDLATSQALPQEGLVAIIGSGTMGTGIAQVAAAFGHPVVLYDTRTEAAPLAIERVRQTFQKLAQKGKMSSPEAERAASRLRSAASLEALRDASLVIEAVVEDLEVKRRLFSALEHIVGANCLLATNTSSLSVSAIAATLQEPGRLIGMHFFNPAPLMELVEIVHGAASDSHVLAKAHATALAWGKTPVHAKSTPGFIVNRVARPFYGEALLLLAEQAGSPSTIDAVMREAGGFRMGPFELMDLVGLDIGLAVSESLFSAYFGDARYRPSFVQQEMVRAGYLGRKAGRGFYGYTDGVSRAEPQTEPGAPRPRQVQLPPNGRLTEAFEKRLAGSDIVVCRATSRQPSEDWIVADDVTLAVTDGRTASQCAQESGRRNFVVLDLALDYTKSARVAIARGCTCEQRSYRSAVGLLQAAGFQVSPLKDVPGLAVMRTVAMLANEAADAVNQGVASASDVDTAMRKGVNYPLGPLVWADDCGLQSIETALANLAAHYGGERYRVSPLIRQSIWAGRQLHESNPDEGAWGTAAGP